MGDPSSCGGTINVDLTCIANSLKKFPISIMQERGRATLKDCHQIQGSNNKGKGRAQVPLSDSIDIAPKVRIKEESNRHIY